jgi:putative SbcD/Mre11-related phosphoesterase
VACFQVTKAVTPSDRSAPIGATLRQTSTRLSVFASGLRVLLPRRHLYIHVGCLNRLRFSSPLYQTFLNGYAETRRMDLSKLHYEDSAVIYENTLIVADLHLGYLNRCTQSASTNEIHKIEHRLESLVESYDIETIVLAGDVFDEFSEPIRTAKKSLQNLRIMMEEKGGQMIVTPGNHDSDSLSWSHLCSSATEEYQVTDDIVVLHGHEPPSKNAQLYICGHLHPTLKIQQNKWPCYLAGCNVYERSDVLVLPPFNEFIGGPAIHKDYEPGIRFPFGRFGFGEYQPLIWDSETEELRKFPTLAEFM